MTSRNPGLSRPGLTKTQQLRQAKSAALLKEYEQKEIGRQQQQPPPQRPVEPSRRRRHVEPKRVDFSKPTMTKAMMARVKHAEKFKQEYERKQEEMMPVRRVPRRTPAPVSGDPRFGRERIPARRAPTPSLPVSPPRRPPRPPPSRRAPEALPPIPEKTKELAKSMNAQVIQAEPVGEGPIDSIVIPPRAVNENRTTIVSIPQPPAAAVEAPVSHVANRSIQVISETLDEQDAAEAAAVHGKLEDLQHARRDFVMAVANVGGNAVQLADEEKPRYLYKIPDIESEMFRVEYGREHPSVVAAREFAQRSMAGIRGRERTRRAEQEFERIAREPLPEDLRFDVPFKEEFFREGDISWEEEGDLALPSRIKTSMRDIPRREPYEYPPFEPEELERFFDVEQYPPSPPRGPPPGREHLHPDLWELEDPWAMCGVCPHLDESDLIDLDSP
ncbi:titin-like [Linepithema humile]|uniref:titin-like n=1 Tax=Linepithema humile TaxID=83485 RepID=UPI000623192F|nr:PREDICTED: titin-like [Linepithema humile]